MGKKFLITQEADIDMLLMNNRVFCGEIAQGLGAAKRLRIVQRAREMNVRLTNGQAKTKKSQLSECIEVALILYLVTNRCWQTCPSFEPKKKQACCVIRDPFRSLYSQ